MKILVTGAKGFVGKNLLCALENIRDGKDKTRPAIIVEEVFQYDINNTDNNNLDSNSSDRRYIYWKIIKLRIVN